MHELEKIIEKVRKKYIVEFAKYRTANYSSVTIFITSDIKRLKEFISIILKFYRRIYYYDLQKHCFFEVKIRNGSILYERIDEEDVISQPYERIYTKLASEKNCFVVMAYVYKRDDVLNDFILSVAIDDTIYAMNSTLVVFSDSEFNFPETFRSFVKIIEIEPPNEKEIEIFIKEIALDVFRKHRRKIKEILMDDDVIKVAKGLSLHEIETATLLSLKETNYSEVKSEYFRKVKEEILKSSGLEIVYPSYGFELVGGYEYIKEFLKRKIINPIKLGLYEKYKLVIPKGILFYGPPGVGKTYIARALAKEINAPFVRIDLSRVFNSLVGESEKNIRKIIRISESLAPVVVFIDEVDQIMFSRNAPITDSGTTRRVQNMILEWLGDENRKSIIICATNLIEAIDRAFIRAGRIDDVVLISYPDDKSRKDIILTIIKKYGIETKINDEQLEDIVKKTEYFSAAELEMLLKEAIFNALENNREYVVYEDVIDSLGKIRINFEKRKNIVKFMEKKLEELRW